MMLYLAVTNDKYELPVAVGETKAELARGLRTTREYVSRFMDKERPRAEIIFKAVEASNE